jgi:UrcA family protein
MTHHPHNLGLALASFAALMISGSAAAQSNGEPVSVSVRFADLDTQHAAGARILLERIQLAASAACGEQPDNRLADQRMAYDQCRKATIGRTLKLLDAPLVNAAARRSERTMPFVDG